MKRSGFDQAVDGKRVDACHQGCFVNRHQARFIAAQRTKGEKVRAAIDKQEPFGFKGDFYAHPFFHTASHDQSKLVRNCDWPRGSLSTGFLLLPALWSGSKISA